MPIVDYKTAIASGAHANILASSAMIEPDTVPKDRQRQRLWCHLPARMANTLNVAESVAEAPRTQRQA